MCYYCHVVAIMHQLAKRYYVMAKRSNTATLTAIPTAPVAVQQAPVAVQHVSTATVVAAKQARYAPLASVDNPNAVLTYAAPNPKVPGSKSHALYATYIAPNVGQTVGQICAAFVAGGLTNHRARRLLRWDLQHGFITLS
jgi:hypothetical protein